MNRSRLIAIAAVMLVPPVFAEEVPPGVASSEVAPPASTPSAGDLALKIQNPVAAVISLPFQNNFDFRVGPAHDGVNYLLNIQPVVPLRLAPELTLIIRPILPIEVQAAGELGAPSASGVGDFSIQTFFLPGRQEKVIWGLGVNAFVPSGSSPILSSGKWSLGPTAVIAKQGRSLTFGLLGRQAWSYAGADKRAAVNQTYMQPFVAYTWKSAWSLTANSETYYIWNGTPGNHWIAPIHLVGSKVVMVHGLPISLGLGARYYIKDVSGGPDVGFRFTINYLFPR